MSADARRLKSRHPFVLAAKQLSSSSDSNNIRAAHWADHQWNGKWADNATRLRIFILDTGTQRRISRTPYAPSRGPTLSQGAQN